MRLEIRLESDGSYSLVDMESLNRPPFYTSPQIFMGGLTKEGSLAALRAVEEYRLMGYRQALHNITESISKEAALMDKHPPFGEEPKS